MAPRKYVPGKFSVRVLNAQARALCFSAIATFILLPAASAKVETWRREGGAAFAKCKREGIVLSDSGELRLGKAVAPLGNIAAARVWDLVKSKGGEFFAATGDDGKVFRRESKDSAAWTLIYDAADTQALSLAILPNGHVIVGTGPTGQVVDLTDPTHTATKPDSKVQYIWDLAADSQGNLYAATGPTGQLWKRATDGKWSLLLDSRHPHILCVALGPDGSVFAGSDGEGLVYRVSREGKVSILYDAPQSEIRALLVAPDGSLYAGTAAEAAGGNSGRSTSSFTQIKSSEGQAIDRQDPSETHSLLAVRRSASSRRIRLIQDTGRDPVRAGTPRLAPPAGSAAPRPVTPGENTVYHLNPDGVAREVFRSKLLIYSLAWVEEKLYIGTGPDGQLYEVRDRGRETVPLTKLENSQILSLLEDGQGGLILGAGDPGAVVQLSNGYLSHGTLTSEVYDTKLLSRFGTLSWRGDLPPETSVAVQLRTGNVGEPDETWSAWSSEQTSPSPRNADVPMGRFAQYRIKFSTRDPRSTPEVRGVSVNSRSLNLPPEINKLEIPDISTADGATRQTKLNLRWDVTDPNDDDLQYSLLFRKEGWPSWLKLGGDSPMTEKSFNWDVAAIPSGAYRLRLVATDRPSNSPDDTLSREKISDPFLVDHDPPSVIIEPKGHEEALVTLKDHLTRMVRAEYALDGGMWTPIFPDDGLFDSPNERITVKLPELAEGRHLLMVRGTDAAGNVGNGDVLLEVKK